MITKYVKGSILDTELKHIVHGVNCQNKMGSGVAKVLYEKYPKVKRIYHMSEHRLGGFVKIPISKDLSIYNLYTQNNYGYDGKKYVSYKAILDLFQELSYYLEGETIAIPKIGCGLAGGDWNVVSALIDEATEDRLNVWVYEL